MGEGWQVTVIDNFDPYYDPAVKRENVEPHLENPDYRLAEVDIRDADALRSVFLSSSFEVIVHAERGVLGAHLPASVPPAVHRTAVLHGIWAQSAA
jgi:nucleoside-diphosphate-sugar epimerase